MPCGHVEAMLYTHGRGAVIGAIRVFHALANTKCHVVANSFCTERADFLGLLWIQVLISKSSEI